MRAILVSVDYADLLRITLAYNRHHFDEVMVVTTPTDSQTHEVADAADALVYTTNSFYDDEADFNKWKAMEEGLDQFGRNGWLCIMDADILWPKQLPTIDFRVGCLYTPLCHYIRDLSGPLPPPESEWSKHPLRRNQVEWAAYSHIFHADDPHLPPLPWYETDWRHAGGADSMLQKRWPRDRKIRPPFNALHLGPHGHNWCGRSTPYLNGSLHPQASERAKRMKRMYHERRRSKGFRKERL